MQFTEAGLVALSVAAFLLLPEGTRKSSDGTQAVTQAVAPLVEIRLGIGGFFVQVAAGRVRSADESATELISAKRISNAPAVAVPEAGDCVFRSVTGLPPLRCSQGGRVQQLPHRDISRRITEGLTDN